MKVKRVKKYDRKNRGYDIKEYDIYGNCIYHKNGRGIEEWFTYNEKNQLIYSIWKYEDRKWDYIYDYDERGNLILKVHTNVDAEDEEQYFRYTEEWKYDENNNEIYHRDGDYEIWKEYDKFGNLIHRKDSYGKEFFWNYDENGIKLFKSAEYEFFDEEE